MFEDVEAFKRIDKKYDERFIKDKKNFIGLALNVSNLYEHKITYQTEGYLNLYCFGYTFKKKFKKDFNSEDDLHNETENFIKTDLEYEDDVFVRADGAILYPSCFANRYIKVKGDNEYGFSEKYGWCSLSLISFK